MPTRATEKDRYGCPLKFFQEKQSRHFMYNFQVADDAMRSQKALPFQGHNENVSC